MKPVVYVQTGGLCKGASAALVRADKALFSCMDRGVCSQGRDVCKGLSAAFKGACKGLLSCMDSLVYFQVVTLGKGLSAALVRAGKALVSCVDSPGPVCLAPDIFMAGDRTSCRACSPAQGPGRFTGGYCVDGGCWSDEVRVTVHGSCRSGYQGVSVHQLSVAVLDKLVRQVARGTGPCCYP